MRRTANGHADGLHHGDSICVVEDHSVFLLLVAVANGIFLSYPLPVGWLNVAGSGRYTHLCTFDNSQYCVETPYSARSLQAERSTEIASARPDSFIRSHLEVTEILRAID